MHCSTQVGGIRKKVLATYFCKSFTGSDSVKFCFKSKNLRTIYVKVLFVLINILILINLMKLINFNCKEIQVGLSVSAVK